MKEILRELQIQRWDDHRYYHHSRINQSLHFVSASSFLCAYALVFFQPVLATLLGWLVAMTARQSGHFFFEPKGYDHVNQATHEYKEADQGRLQPAPQGAALRGVRRWRRCRCSSTRPISACSRTGRRCVHNVAMVWLALGAGGLLFRGVHLFFLRDVRTGTVWMLKILTDPFHDLKLYWKAPLALMRGELIDESLALAAQQR